MDDDRAPLTSEFQDAPETHNGEDAFTVRVAFSEAVAASYRTLRDHALDVTGGRVREAKRVDGRSDLWRITIEPDSDVTVVLPVTDSCDAEGAVCTGDGSALSNRLELTVPGPVAEKEKAPENSPASGAPGITGTARVGETLTADTSGIADADGLDNASFSYQWLADDAEISGATGSGYTLADAQAGKTIKVRVSFTDDAGNAESLTSGATAAVEAAPTPNSPATGAPAITGSARVGETLTADTSGIVDADGLTNATFSYQWLADDTAIAGATASTYTLVDADEGKAVRVKVSFTDDAGNQETLTSAATAAVEAAVAEEEPVEPPLAPENLTATVNEDGSVTLNWEAQDHDSVTGYLILRRRPYEGEKALLVYVENTGSTATTFTDTNVTAGTQHVYRVKAINDAGAGNQSNYVNVDP